MSGMTARISRIIAALIGLLLFTSFVPAGAAFPAIDPARLKITLQRTACFGSCPDYRVTIHGDGRVVFESTPDQVGVSFGAAEVHRAYSSDSGIRVAGIHRTRVDPSQVQRLVEQFRRTGFFALRDEYVAQVTDSRTNVLSIDTGNGAKTVVDYVGTDVGMPEAVRDLQAEVDRVAATDRWIDGTPDAIPYLQFHGVRFDSTVGLELMDAAASRGDVETMKRLKLLGAPIRAKQGPSPVLTAVAEGKIRSVHWLILNGALDDDDAFRDALERSVALDNHQLIDPLLKDPRAKRAGGAFMTKLLVDAARNGDPAVVELALANGGDVHGAGVSRFALDRPLFEASNGISAQGQHPASDRHRVVRALLDAGAKPEYCKAACETALWMVSDATIAEMLIRSGADPDFRDAEGEHILFSVHDEAAALTLIAHGANLKAVRPADKMTLRGWAKYQRWQKVLALLRREGL
jgi:hypothetical protein